MLRSSFAYTQHGLSDCEQGCSMSSMFTNKIQWFFSSDWIHRELNIPHNLLSALGIGKKMIHSMFCIAQLALASVFQLQQQLHDKKQKQVNCETLDFLLFVLRCVY